MVACMHKVNPFLVGGSVLGVVLLLIPLCHFHLSVYSSWLAQMSEADSGLCSGYMVKDVNKVKGIFAVSIREGQVHNEGIKEE